MIYLLGLLPLLIILLFLAKYMRESKRPKNKLITFKTRFTDTVWTSEQIELAMTIFFEAWSDKYPEIKKQSKKKLDNLNIIWTDKRWDIDKEFVIGQVVDSNTIKLWKGPQLINNIEYKLNYTAFPETLIQYLSYSIFKEKLEYKDIFEKHKDILNVIRRRNSNITKYKQNKS